MKDRTKENRAIVRDGRAAHLETIRGRAIAHKHSSRTAAWWTDAERDRADLLIMVDLLQDELEDMTQLRDDIHADYLRQVEEIDERSRGIAYRAPGVRDD